MKIFTEGLTDEVAALLRNGKIGVIRTDTLYGVVAQAGNELAVERVYHAKGRDETKSPIVLIASLDQLFDKMPGTLEQLVVNGWPEKTSIIIPSEHAPHWIRRKNNTVAYRLPRVESLCRFLEKSGPLIAPSANPEGCVPAMSLNQAVDYFGDQVDFYVDGGAVHDDTPSKLLRVDAEGRVEQIR